MVLNPSAVLKLTSLKRLILYALVSIVGYFALVRIGFLFPLKLLPEVVCFTPCAPPEPLHPAEKIEDVGVQEEAIASLLPSYFDRDKVTILIEKADHRLTVFYDLRPIKSYPVVFGENPVGDKRNEGDRKTPEGIFRIRDLYPHAAWSKFLWLDYPTPQDWRDHFQAKGTGNLNWLLPIGGQVGIHGVPNNDSGLIETQTNWTWGCPSMKNQDVDELYSVVQIGTVVEILP